MMSKYSVEIDGIVSFLKRFEVEAESDEEAEQIANELWREDGGPEHLLKQRSHDAYVTKLKEGD